MKTLLMGAAAALAFLALQPSAAEAASHYECRVHGFRPYPHRHVDPDDQMIPCDRPAETGRFPTAAVCVAHGQRRGGEGRVVPGSQINSSVPLYSDADALERTDALNAACAEALIACEDALYARGLGGASCRVIDRYFSK